MQVAINYSFHPKFWLLKYLSDQGEILYRIIILSRNLTFDRSWDLAVSLDGVVVAKANSKNGPLQDFLLYLRGARCQVLTHTVGGASGGCFGN